MVSSVCDFDPAAPTPNFRKHNSDSAPTESTLDQMSISPGCEGDDSELVETGKLHTRCASPRRLTQELAQLLGGARFMVEVRQDFFISSSTGFLAVV